MTLVTISSPQVGFANFHIRNWFYYPQGCCGDLNLRWISQRGIMPGHRRATGENYCNNLSFPASILLETYFVEVDSFIFYSQTCGNFFNF